MAPASDEHYRVGAEASPSTDSDKSRQMPTCRDMSALRTACARQSQDWIDFQRGLFVGRRYNGQAVRPP
jgi:hypothetical protein